MYGAYLELWQGGQCENSQKNGDLCGSHAKNLSCGRVDGPIPTGKLAEFLRASTRLNVSDSAKMPTKSARIAASSSHAGSTGEAAATTASRTPASLPQLPAIGSDETHASSAPVHAVPSTNTDVATRPRGRIVSGFGVGRVEDVAADKLAASPRAHGAVIADESLAKSGA